MKTLLLLPLCLLFVFGCSRDEAQPAEDHLNSLNFEENNVVENMPTFIGGSSGNIILPNEMTARDFLLEVDADFYNQWGKSSSPNNTFNISGDYSNLAGPQDQRNALIAKLGVIATNLMDRSKHQYGSQDGIAYSFGSKTLALQKPPYGQCQDTELVGLDCSGFLYQVFINAGITNFPGPGVFANDQRNPAIIENAIKSSVAELDKIKVENMRVNAKIIAGDIIYWTRKDKKGNDRAFHVGIVINYGNRLVVAQSNGTDEIKGDCNANLGKNRGPRPVELDDLYWFKSGKPYGIVRINSNISGKYNFSFACDGNSSDFFTEELSFPNDTSHDFNIDKPFIDVDGSANLAKFSFSWNHETNVLNCSVIITDGAIPGFERKDSFSKKLLRDNLDYFRINNDYVHNGTGCVLKAKLNYVN